MTVDMDSRLQSSRSLRTPHRARVDRYSSIPLHLAHLEPQMAARRQPQSHNCVLMSLHAAVFQTAELFVTNPIPQRRVPLVPCVPCLPSISHPHIHLPSVCAVIDHRPRCQSSRSHSWLLPVPIRALL
jgi:hypothetical protein